ncbi:MarR family transcriptional regulator [Eubacteriales bacterium OttesenSCG-928-N14]|nr:MarR family transcriptional regulator [Eubacteriales bacterium OttesenSCG-928-N14]
MATGNTVRERIIAQIYDLYLMMRGQANMLFPTELGGLRPNQLMIMHILFDNPNITMGDLAKRINVAKANLTPLVDDLIEHGYAKRTTGTTDRRTICVSITQKGEDYMQRLHDHVARQLDNMLDGLNEEEKQELLEALITVGKLRLRSMK